MRRANVFGGLCCTTSVLLRILLIIAGVAFGHGALLDFDPFQLFRSDQGSPDDLIVVLHPRRALGRTPLYTAMNDFAGSVSALGRKRGLVVSHCRECRFFNDMLRRWHVKDDQLPIAVLFPHCKEDADEGKFHLDLKLGTTADEILRTLQDFVRRYDAGKEHHFVFSAPVPTKEDQDGPVFELVGSTFEDEVVGRIREQSSLVLFYKPWCGWCRQVQPTFKALAQKIGTTCLLRVARIDSDQNEIPTTIHAELNAVPAIYLFTPDRYLNPIPFPHPSDRTVDRIFTWALEVVPGLRTCVEERSQKPAGSEDAEDKADL